MIIPREFFPNMPDEVFEMWLEPIAEDYGWPFQNQFDTTEETKWFYVLGELSLSFWVNAKWEFSKWDLSTTPFSYGSHSSVRGILDRCINSLPTLYAGVHGSEERFRACADYIRINGTIPKPLVFLIRDGAFDILDGSHRLAALIHISIPSGYKIPAWVTEIKTNKNINDQ